MVKRKKVLMPPTLELPWKVLFGEKSSILLEGSRISADKIINEGYKFQYPYLDTALDNLLNS
jgi:NAD dependent epimerase/dehydratase family enzyme